MDETATTAAAASDATVMDTVIAWLTVKGINIAVALALLVVGWWIARIIRHWVTRYLERTDHMDPLVEHFLSSLVYYGVLAVILIAALNLMGVQTASLIAVVGAASLAIGLALQGSLTSLAAGVMIILIRPFRVGDYIEVSDEAGTVKAITLFQTELATYDNIQKLMPNSQVWNATVTNYSVYQTRMLDIEIGIDYEDTVDDALAVLIRLAEAEEKVLAEPAPNAFVSGLGESSVDLTLRVWVPTSDYWPLKRKLTQRAKEEIEGNGMSIPFPHRQLIPVKGTGAKKTPGKGKAANDAA